MTNDEKKYVNVSLELLILSDLLHMKAIDEKLYNLAFAQIIRGENTDTTESGTSEL